MNQDSPLIADPFYDPKRLGAFYTPTTIADMLAEWAVRSGYERVLEPSAGEGALVKAASNRSAQMHGTPRVTILACDINRSVIPTIASHLPENSEAIEKDFLDLEPTSTGLFDAVIANPPFTRNHAISGEIRVEIRRRFQVSGAAGLWVYFILHSFKFLKVGGKIAAVIPAAALFSNYGREALERVSEQFSTVELREFNKNPAWVNNADERGLLLLAGGFRQGSCATPQRTKWTTTGAVAEVDPASDAEFQFLLRCSHRLEKIAKISIGAVTGHNLVFLLDEETRRRHGIPPSEVRPIVSRARHVPALTVGAASLRRLAAAGERTLLLSPQSIDERGSGSRKQLARINAQRRRTTRWFQKRNPWWRVSVPECQAIFTYMNDKGPRLVLQNDDIGCTNTLHCVTFIAGFSRREQEAASLSLLSTFGQLAGEILGRRYGGGVLKFELKDARGLPILPAPSDVGTAFSEADVALQNGNHSLATEIADRAIVAPILGPGWLKAVARMRVELADRRKTRRGC
ncbi:Eco57I restriction-modification methylase domain-containing protein [Histidinibacterium aquaticum]|uniref:site-specific DNA-methyltransferase (adenine-specific) n=1 Tax=Histidinibacterium aquaticum TaxID=2613962 RepID=A0A5J5GPQ1_9RHOB|nr:N-6 DNA methylase [Histidinibacterium aquaticum]KAA9010356.1 N-6 DNA methylase [Histidinibacterium aquaticum]